MIKTAATVLALGLALAGAHAFADDMGKDNMGMQKQDTMTKKDAMKKNSMQKKDGMAKKDAMKKDAMGKDGMAR